MSMYGLDLLNGVIQRAENLLDAIKSAGQYPHNEKVLDRLWNTREVGDLLGKNKATISRTAANLIASGEMDDFTQEQRHPTTEAVMGYTLKQLNAMRQHYGLMPSRNALMDECLLGAIQVFKGGTGKSITTAYLAQNLAGRGYRGLVVDMDPQASLTSLFGYMPDIEIDISDTITPFIEGSEPDLKYAVRKTNWDGLNLIPSQLQTNDNDILMAFKAAEIPDAADRIHLMVNKLKRGLESLKADYDFILLDCPPALSMSTLNILCAVDAVIIPSPPALFDFSSTLQYLRMIKTVITRISPDKQYKFIKILRTKNDKRRSSQQFSQAMEKAFGDYLLPCEFPQMQEVSNATTEFMTFLEDRRPKKAPLEIVDEVTDYIELEMLKTWPSKGIEVNALENKIKSQELEHEEA